MAVARALCTQHFPGLIKFEQYRRKLLRLHLKVGNIHLKVATRQVVTVLCQVDRGQWRVSVGGNWAFFVLASVIPT